MSAGRNEFDEERRDEIAHVESFDAWRMRRIADWRVAALNDAPFVREVRRNPSMSAAAMSEGSAAACAEFLCRNLDSEIAMLLSGGTTGGAA